MKRLSPLNVRRHRVICRHCVTSLIYFRSAVVFLKLAVAFMSSTASGTQMFYVQLPVTHNNNISSAAVADDINETTIAVSTRNAKLSLPLKRPMIPSRQQTTSSIADERLVVHITWFYERNTRFRFHEALCLLAVQRFV